MLVKFIPVLTFSPIFFIPGIAALAIDGWVGQMYIKAQLSIKWEVSNARSPVLQSHLTDSVAGVGARLSHLAVSMEVH